MKEHNQFRLRLNLFDGIVLVLALAAAYSSKYSRDFSSS